MGAIRDDPQEDPTRSDDWTTNRRHWTTVVLEEQADGRWLATQTGVAVEGYGDTAAEAAARYCRQISEPGDG